MKKIERTFKNMVKKLSLLMISGILFSGQAFAYDGALNSKFHVGAKVGVVKFGDQDAVQYGFVNLNEFKLGENGNHRINTDFSYLNSTKFKEDDNKIFQLTDKTRTYDLKVTYGYNFDINENISIVPKIGLGYEDTKLSVTRKNSRGAITQDLSVKRVYATTGVQTTFKTGETFSISPSLNYEKDLKLKDLVNKNVKGSAYEVKVDFTKEFENENLLTFTPYYKVYDNKAFNDKIKTSGLEVKYAF